MRLRYIWVRTSLVLLPYLLWLVLMPLTGQYDLMLNAWQAHHVNKGYWNLYAHLSQTNNFAVPGHPPAPYPFGFYLLLAGWIELLHALRLADYTAWRSPLVLLEFPATLLALKLPYLATHLATGILLFKAAPLGWRWAALTLWAWSLSPAYLLLMGQNDLPLALSMTAATLLSAQALSTQQAGHSRWRWAALASAALLGLGATYKTASLMLVLPFALLLSKRWRDRLVFFGIPIAIFAISTIPFLGTPAFVNGALLNPEGTRLFSSTQLFAQPASLFLVAYAVLLLILAVRPHQKARPLDFWLIGAAVFAALFLFAWTQFYWLVWLTPFVIGLLTQDAPRRALWLGVWLISEVAFGVLLFGRHRDLGWGLLGLGSEQFRLAQFEVVMDLSPLPLRRPFEVLWSVLHSAQMAALLGALAAAGISLARVRTFALAQLRQSFVVAIVALPALACIGAAAVTLLLSRNAVAREFDRPTVSEARLSAAQLMLTQVFSPVIPAGNILLLWATPPTDAMLLEACMHADTHTVCALGQPLQSSFFSGYAFWFGSASAGKTRAFTLRLLNPSSEAILAMPIVRHRPRLGEQHRVLEGEHTHEGIVRMSVLHPFNPIQAISDLYVWLTMDWRLGILLTLSLFGVLAGVTRCATYPVRRKLILAQLDRAS